jgi:hypothetical protein
VQNGYFNFYWSSTIWADLVMFFVETWACPVSHRCWCQQGKYQVMDWCPLVAGASQHCNGVRRGKPTLRRCETGQAHVSTTIMAVTSCLCREESCQVVAEIPLHRLSVVACIDAYHGSGAQVRLQLLALIDVMEVEHKYGCYCRDVGLPRLTQMRVPAGEISSHGLMSFGCGGKPTLQWCETGQAHTAAVWDGASPRLYKKHHQVCPNYQLQ